MATKKAQEVLAAAEQKLNQASANQNQNNGGTANTNTGNVQSAATPTPNTAPQQSANQSQVPTQRTAPTTQASPNSNPVSAAPLPEASPGATPGVTPAPALPTAPNLQTYTAQAPDFTGLLDSWLASAQKQQETAVDYATQQGISELERNQADAEEQFQTQRNQVDVDEAKALDNQALYAESRGDKGGIGQAQFGQIQATAMTNRRAINSARTKLATDTARQIADLRAKGEFEKADALLQLTQTYLSQLIQLQQWGAEYTLNVQQMNNQLQQWQAEFNMSAAQWQTEFTAQQNQWAAQNQQWLSEFNANRQQWQTEFNAQQNQWQQQFDYGKQQDAIANQQWQQQFDNANKQWQTEFEAQKDRWQVQDQQWREQFEYGKTQDALNAKQREQEFNRANANTQQQMLAQSGLDALSVGIRPSAQQQAAMGYTDEQIDGALAVYEMELAAKKAGGTGGKPETKVEDAAPNLVTNPYDYLYYYGVSDATTAAGMLQKQFGDYALDMADQYMEMLNTGAFTGETSKAPANGGSSGYKAVQSTLTRAPGLTMLNKVDIIEDAWNNKRITDEEAGYLLDLIGYTEG